LGATAFFAPTCHHAGAKKEVLLRWGGYGAGPPSHEGSYGAITLPFSVSVIRLSVRLLMLEAARIYFAVFAIISILGGVMGFVKAKSRASLIAGSISGALLLVAAWLLPGRAIAGLVTGLVVSLLLAGRFVPSLLNKGGFMPNGLMAVLSVGGFGFALAALFAL
jgi:uncharacterized membrane protein (UPF0136 family)